MGTTSVDILQRRSIRRYQDRPVAGTTVAEILAEARWAPSAGNTQSTAVFVVTDAALERTKAALLEAVENDSPPAPDIEPAAQWPEPYKSRMADLFETRTTFVAAEGDTPGAVRAEAAPSPRAVMAGLFGAPVLLLLAIDRDVSPAYGCFDAGLLAQTIALSAHARGLGTCIMTSTVRAADALHRALPEAEGKALVAAITLGYPDLDAPINRFPRARVTPDEFVVVVQ
jgi:nitroreductase